MSWGTRGWFRMLANRVKLTTKEILEKEFKICFRGYKQEEVDKFLDLIIKDYEVMYQLIEEVQQENAPFKKASRRKLT